MQVLLAYEGDRTDLEAVARYQRDRLGVASDETAIIELSAHHVVSTDVDVARSAHRNARVALIRQPRRIGN